MSTTTFPHEQVNRDKLRQYGFQLVNGLYHYQTTLLDGKFILDIDITPPHTVTTKVWDRATQDEYTLHLVADAAGAFVGKVRTQYQDCLADLRTKCFERAVFQSPQAQEIIHYVQTRYGDPLEYLWEKFPTNAVSRRQDNQKWYAVWLVIPRAKLGLPGTGTVEIIDLRADPTEMPARIDYKSFFPGYHMNKKHWLTICLDGTVPTPTIIALLDQSYALAH